MKNTVHKIVPFFISLVWFVNGFFCKVLNLVPRHQEIVARVLNAEYDREITFIIGVRNNNGHLDFIGFQIKVK